MGIDPIIRHNNHIRKKNSSRRDSRERELISPFGKHKRILGSSSTTDAVGLVKIRNIIRDKNRF